MSSRTIRISSRELMETLAGLSMFDDAGGRQEDMVGSAQRPASEIRGQFFRCLQQGRLLAAVTVIKTDENDDDDWVEFDFGDPDPAISPFR